MDSSDVLDLRSELTAAVAPVLELLEAIVGLLEGIDARVADVTTGLASVKKAVEGVEGAVAYWAGGS